MMSTSFEQTDETLQSGQQAAAVAERQEIRRRREEEDPGRGRVRRPNPTAAGLPFRQSAEECPETRSEGLRGSEAPASDGVRRCDGVPAILFSALRTLDQRHGMNLHPSTVLGLFNGELPLFQDALHVLEEILQVHALLLDSAFHIHLRHR